MAASYAAHCRSCGARNGRPPPFSYLSAGQQSHLVKSHRVKHRPRPATPCRAPEAPRRRQRGPQLCRQSAPRAIVASPAASRQADRRNSKVVGEEPRRGQRPSATASCGRGNHANTARKQATFAFPIRNLALSSMSYRTASSPPIASPNSLHSLSLPLSLHLSLPPSLPPCPPPSFPPCPSAPPYPPRPLSLFLSFSLDPYPQSPPASLGRS